MEVLDGSGEDVAEVEEQEGLHLAVAIATGLVVLLSLALSIARWTWRAWRRSSVPVPAQRAAGRVKVASPPPLTRLQDLDARQAFSKTVEVINLVSPSSTASTPSGTTGRRRPLTPGGSTPSTSAASPDRGTALATCVVSAVGKVAQLAKGMAKRPAMRPRQQQQQQRVRAGPAGETQGWDPALLAASRQQEAYISSLEGLQQSKEFQKHVRDKHGNLDRHMEQVNARLGIYRMLRSFDRQGFMHALNRQDILDFDSQPPSLLLCVLEAGLTGGATMLAFWLGMHSTASISGSETITETTGSNAQLVSGAGSGLTLVGWWLVVQAVFAWWGSYPSLVARWLDMLCVRDCERYPEHSFTAPMWRVAAAGLLDALFACTTCGCSCGVSLLLAALRPSARQSLGQMLLGVRPIREVECGRVTVPQFQSPPPKLQRAGIIDSGLAGTPLGGLALASSFATPQQPTPTTTYTGRQAQHQQLQRGAAAADAAATQPGLVGVFGSARKRAAAGSTTMTPADGGFGAMQDSGLGAAQARGFGAGAARGSTPLSYGLSAGAGAPRSPSRSQAFQLQQQPQGSPLRGAVAGSPRGRAAQGFGASPLAGSPLASEGYGLLGGMGGDQGFAFHTGAGVGVPAPSPAAASAPPHSPHVPWAWGSGRRVLPPSDLLLAAAQEQPSAQSPSTWGSPASQYGS